MYSAHGLVHSQRCHQTAPCTRQAADGHSVAPRHHHVYRRVCVPAAPCCSKLSLLTTCSTGCATWPASQHTAAAQIQTCMHAAVPRSKELSAASCRGATSLTSALLSGRRVLASYRVSRQASPSASPPGLVSDGSQGTASEHSGSDTDTSTESSNTHQTEGEQPAQPKPYQVKKYKPPPIQPLPDLRQCKHFINLTNGLEAVPCLEELGMQYSFVRIQSTACEQQNFEGLMNELDANLMVSLALGHVCLVYDCGSRITTWGVPRAVWYGLEFVRYTLTRLWLGRDAAAQCGALVRGYNSASHFEERIAGFKQSTVKRIRYYMKWLPADGLTQIRLHGVYRATEHDSDTAFYRALIESSQGTGPLRTCASSGAAAAAGLPPRALSIQKVEPGVVGADASSQVIEDLPGRQPDLQAEQTLAASGWQVYHRGLTTQEWKALNGPDAKM